MSKTLSVLVWVLVALAGAGAFGVIALARGDAARAKALMNEHLDAVAGRALIEARRA